MQWFRLHTKLLHDPKVQMLEPEVFKIYINCLCLAAERDKNGELGNVSSVSFVLRETKQSVSSAFHTLTKAALLVTVDETFHIKSWNKNQYKSDTSTERVRKYREKMKRAGNVTVTAPEQSRTDTDTEQSRADAGGREVFHQSCLLAGIDFERKPNKRAMEQSEKMIDDWMKKGADHKHILQTIKTVMDKRRKEDPHFSPNSLKYFNSPVLEALSENLNETIDPQFDQWRGRLTTWQRNGKWMDDFWGPPPEHQHTRVPPELLDEYEIKNSTAGSSNETLAS